MSKLSDRLDGAVTSEMPGAWSFLPYEEERETPRRELQFLRAVHALVIPVVDVAAIAGAVLVSYFITQALLTGGYVETILGGGVGALEAGVLWIGLGSTPLWLLVFQYFGVYSREMRRLSISTFDELPQTIGAAAVGAWLMFSLLLLANRGALSGRALWLFVAVAWAMLMMMIPLGRASVRIGFSFRNPFRTSTLVVGAGEVGRSLVGRLGRHKEYGLRVVGFLDTSYMEEEPDEEEQKGALQLLGRPSELRTIVDRYGISRVLIAFSRTPHPQMLDIIHQCQEMKVDVSIVPRFFQALSTRVEIEDIEGLPIMSLPRYARHGWMMRRTKRLMDLAGVTIASILLAPVLLLTALAIRLDSRGPVFYTQERMGKGHKRFRMYKFRSMRADSESQRDEMKELNEVTGPIFKMKDDPRITRVGRVIRRLSIDELPQMINVFKGEMSLVGPRPLPVEEAEACQGTADMRHQVQPGITGLWQILGRSDIPYEEMVQLDYLYVTNWTLRWDIKIILRTVIAIVRKRGAY
ncbi:MAG: sugar transferase [Thermoleophilia bacterium]|nr:sugar transferase [Thermoleophilia bacterium]